MQDCEILIGGELWKIRFVSSREIGKRKWGLCIYATQTILVRNNLSHKNTVDTLIHEITHAQRPHESEAFVNQTSSETTAGLRLSGLIGD